MVFTFKSEVLQCLTLLFLLAKLFGLFPYSLKSDRLVLSKPVLAYSLVILVNEFLMFGFRVKSIVTFESTKKERAEDLADMIYFLNIFGVIAILLSKSRSLDRTIRILYSTELKLLPYRNRNLQPICWLLTGLCYVLLFVDHTNYVITIIRECESSRPIECIGELSAIYGLPEEYFSNSTIGGVYAIVTETLLEVRWIFSDSLLLVISFIILNLFLRLNNYIITVNELLTFDRVETLRVHHQRIQEIVQVCNDLLGPLVILGYIGNTCYIMCKLYAGLSADDGDIFSYYEVGYAFTFMIARIIVPSVVAAKMNEEASKCFNYLRRWPSNIKTKRDRLATLTLIRFECDVTSCEIGVSGCGYFVITKTFVMTLVSALVSYEVVLLQFQASGTV